MDFVTPLLGLLVPHLPGLVTKAAEAVVGEGAKKAVFGAVPEGVKEIWKRLRPKVQEDVTAKAAALKLADEPESAQRLAVLKVAIEDVLKELAAKDPDLVVELKKLMEQNKPEASGGNSATVTAGTIYSSVVGPNATVTQTIGCPGK